MIEKPKILSDEELLKEYKYPALVNLKRLRNIAQAQNDYCYKEMVEQLRILILQAITDEPEYPSNMPDELWEELNNNRDNVTRAMRSTVRLTKNGITERFLKALQP